MPLIPITGVPSSYKVPGQYAEVVFAQGPATAASPARAIMCVMPKLAASGNWTAATVYKVRSEQDAIDGAGQGSPLHRALKRILRTNKTAPIYALPYLPTSGGAPVAADLDVTWTTAPTGTGVTTLTVAGEDISVGFNSSDTVTTIATKVRDAVNARPWLPVTATNAAGVLTLTAKILGASQNGHIRVRAKIDPGKGTTVATENASDVDALGTGAAAAGADGTTTENANLVAALGSIDASRYYYLVGSVDDATNVASLRTHVSSKSEPIPGLRSVVIVGSPDTLANMQTRAVAQNHERVQIVWQLNSEATKEELAANMASIRQKKEALDTAYNFDFYSNRGDWLVPGCFRDADRPTGTDLNDAITDGITPIATNDAGSYVVMSVNTRSKDAAGTNDDFRATESHRVSVGDDYTDTVLLRHAVQYTAKKLRDDERLADGSVNPNQRLIPGIVTPSTYSLPGVVLDEFDLAGKIQEVAASREGMRRNVDPNNNGRLEVGVELRVIDHLHQMTLRVAEVSPG